MNRIDYKNTRSCENDKTCSIEYNTFTDNKDSKWQCKNNLCKLTCYSDNDCGAFGICDNNICRNKKDYIGMYKGCLNEDRIDDFKKHQNNSGVENIDSCIYWSRKTKCKDGNNKDTNCKYMIYKDKVETPIDWQKFNATISCKVDSNNVNAQRITGKIKEYCQRDESYDKCIYNTANNYLNNIIKDGIKEFDDCKEFKLSYSYGCKNQKGEEPKRDVFFTADDIGKKKLFDIKCPTGNNKSFNEVCISGDIDKKYISNSNDRTKCKYPVYKIPHYYKSKEEKDFVKKQKIDNKIRELNNKKEIYEKHSKNLDYEMMAIKKNYKTMDGKYDIDRAENDVKNRETKDRDNKMNAFKKVKNNFITQFNKKIEENSKYANKYNRNIMQKISINNKNIKNYDSQINKISQKIMQSKYKEKLNIKIASFFSILLFIFFLLGISVFIYFNLKNRKINLINQ